jgi:hypothetical protein
MLHDLPREDQDLDDPAVFINTDIRNAFQEMCRQTSFDTLMGVATQTYDGGRVQPGDTIPTINELEPFLGYFWAMHSTECTNRFTLPEVSKVMGWKWDDTVCLSTPSGAGCSPVIGARGDSFCT